MQTYKVFLSDLARADLRDIVAYVSIADSIERAKYVERGLLSAMKLLSTFPTIYPQDEYASIPTREIRFVVKWRCKILFFIEADTVQVVGIFHTSQNTDKLASYRL
ncbi:hypothetical protein AGMMS49525_06220 [Bacteroidia bacterium]|nr:hypothetical protein AGMMS49525_06220 [Bacteroidia bacterium]